MRIQTAVCVVLFVGFLAALAVQTAFHPVQEPFLYGVFKPLPQPSLSFASWWDGRFQRQVQGTEQAEGWMDRHVGFRSVWIKTEGQINFSLFREIATTANPQGIILGKDNWLYEQDYIDDFLGLDAAPSKYLQQFAADLKSLQDDLKQRNVTMLLVISPSKAAHYPEYLPDWIVRQREILHQHEPGWKSNYDLLRPMLDRQGVHCVDAVKRFREEKQRQQDSQQDYRLFARGGTHWSHYGASLVTVEILRRLKELSGKDLLQLQCRGVSVDCQTTGTDNDLGSVLNIWTPWVTKGPTPHPHLLGRPGTWSPDVLWVGNSFSDALTELMDMYRVYRRRDTLFNFLRRTTYPEGKTRPVDRANFDWEHELLTRDVVVIEVNEAQLSEVGYGFVRGALEFLRKQTPPSRRWGMSAVLPRGRNGEIRTADPRRRTAEERIPGARSFFGLPPSGLRRPPSSPIPSPCPLSPDPRSLIPLPGRGRKSMARHGYTRTIPGSQRGELLGRLLIASHVRT